MRFSILSLLVLTCFIALATIGYLWIASPLVLRVGMERDDVLSNLQESGAVDLIEREWLNTAVYSTYTVLVPTGDAGIDHRNLVESKRQVSFPVNDGKANAGGLWHVGSVGRRRLRVTRGSNTMHTDPRAARFFLLACLSPRPGER